jgi:CelD/BcsL family acetyltransferase involved in cellulose biosynthesis
MNVDIIDTEEGFSQLRARWDAVHVLDPQADYFLSWRWLWEVLRANPGKWQILAAREDRSGSEYLGFLPLRLSTRRSRSRGELETELEAAGRLAWAQYTGFVCHPEWERPAITAIAEAVRQSPWAYFSLTNCSASADRLDLFLKGFDAGDYDVRWAERFDKGGAVDNLVCPFVELPADYETWLQRLGPNARQKVRRFSRRLEASREMRISITPPDEFRDRLEQMLELWLRKWEPVRGAEDARYNVEKYQEIFSRSHACDALFLPAFWQGETMLGALATIVDRDKRWMYFIAAGRDEESTEPAIGLLLHAFSIRWGIENGIRVYDLCHGNEPYKYSLGAIDRRIRNLEIRRRLHVPTGRFDPRCLGQALDRIVKYMQTDRVGDAVLACRQLRRLYR